jgi:hypothetical protein
MESDPSDDEAAQQWYEHKSRVMQSLFYGYHRRGYAAARSPRLLLQVDERAFLVADDDVGQPVAVDVRGNHLGPDA